MPGARAGPSPRPRPRRPARPRRSRRPAGRTPSPPARPCRSPPAATGRRRPPPLVVRPELGRRHEADRLREQRPQRPVPDDDERQAVRPPRPARGRPSPQTAARRRARAAARRARPPSPGCATPLGITRTSRAPSARASRRARSTRTRRPAHAGRASGRAAHAPRERDVRPPELEHERLAGRERGERLGQPVRVHEVGVARGRGGPHARTRPGRAAAPAPSTARAEGC